MGIVIDTNVISMVFDPANTNHQEFKPVLDSLLSRRTKSKLVFGGSKYINEVNSFKKYLGLLTTLNRIGKTVRLNDTDVDNKQSTIENDLKKLGLDPVGDDNYNDCHILAMIIVGKAKLVASNDLKSIPLIRDKKYYAHTSHVPVFYTSLRNIRLLKDPSYMVNCL